MSVLRTISPALAALIRAAEAANAAYEAAPCSDEPDFDPAVDAARDKAIDAIRDFPAATPADALAKLDALEAINGDVERIWAEQAIRTRDAIRADLQRWERPKGTEDFNAAVARFLASRNALRAHEEAADRDSDGEDADAAFDRLLDEEGAAFAALLETPSPTVVDFADKMRHALRIAFRETLDTQDDDEAMTRRLLSEPRNVPEGAFARLYQDALRLAGIDRPEASARPFVAGDWLERVEAGSGARFVADAAGAVSVAGSDDERQAAYREIDALPTWQREMVVRFVRYARA